MKTERYKLSTEYHVDRCKTAAEKGNLRLLSAYLTYALYDLGLDDSQEKHAL